ncbi:MAG: hypothetical protein ACYS9H_09625 [Planctomycetota bacterium]
MKQTIGLVMTVLAVGFSVSAGLVDSVSTPFGLTASGQWQTDGFQVAWDISPKGDRMWRYRYEFTKPAGASLKKDISYLIIQVSDTMTAQDISGGWVPGWYETGSPSTPGLPGAIWGVKVEHPGAHVGGLLCQRRHLTVRNGLERCLQQRLRSLGVESE